MVTEHRPVAVGMLLESHIVKLDLPLAIRRTPRTKQFHDKVSNPPIDAN